MNKQNSTKLNILKEIVGNDLFQEVAYKLGGQALYIPPDADFYDKAQRNDLILVDFFNGLNRSALAVKYGLSKSRIDKIIAARPKEKVI